MSLVELRNVSKSYGPLKVLDQVSLSVNKGEVIAVIGRSGSGKSTMLRCINGLEPIQGGEIIVDGQKVNDPNTDLRKLRQGVGIVFQSFNLFPHLSVSDNITLAPRIVKGERPDQARAVALDVLGRVGLADKIDAFPHQLSGGQQQRVALARALAPEPDLLLLDEPFSNLDVDTRERLAFEVRDILKKTGHTALLVTHNQAEAFAIADRIGIMADGALLQWDTPFELHHHPSSKRVADFIHREALSEQQARARLRHQDR